MKKVISVVMIVYIMFQITTCPRFSFSNLGHFTELLEDLTETLNSSQIALGEDQLFYIIGKFVL